MYIFSFSFSLFFVAKKLKLEGIRKEGKNRYKILESCCFFYIILFIYLFIFWSNSVAIRFILKY